MILQDVSCEMLILSFCLIVVCSALMFVRKSLDTSPNIIENEVLEKLDKTTFLLARAGEQLHLDEGCFKLSRSTNLRSLRVCSECFAKRAKA